MSAVLTQDPRNLIPLSENMTVTTEMLWALGALICLVCFPGLMIVRNLDLNDLADAIIVSFCLSIGFHFVLQVVLLLCGVSYTFSARFVVATELVLLFYFSVRQARKLRKFPSISCPVASVVVASCIVFLISLKFWISAFYPFHTWDAVTSYNYWAVSWFHLHRFPLGDHDFAYPQLIPLAWSFIYRTAGGTASVENVARMLMPCFGVVVVLGMVRLSRITNLPWAFGVGVLMFCFPAFFFYIDKGYVDIPVAAFAFSALVLYLRPQRFRHDLAVIGFVLGLALLTKQSGLLVLLCFGITALLARKAFVHGRPAWLPMALAAAFAAPWYLYAFSRTFDNTWYLWTTIHRGRSLAERIYHGLHSFPFQLLAVSYNNLINAVLVAVLAAAGCSSARIRALCLGWFLPFFIVWVALYSYDVRNFFPAIPVLGLVIGAGMHTMWQLAAGRVWGRTARLLKICVLIAVFSVIAANSVQMVRYHEDLFSKVRHSFMSLDEKRLDLLPVYSVIAFLDVELEKGPDMRVLTDDIMLYRIFYPREKISFFLPVEEKTWWKTGKVVLRPFPAVHAGDLLVFHTSFAADRNQNKFARFMEEKVRSRRYEEIFRYRGYRVYRVLSS